MNRPRTIFEIDQMRTIVAERSMRPTNTDFQRACLQGMLVALVWAAGDDEKWGPDSTMERLLRGEA